MNSEFDIAAARKNLALATQRRREELRRLSLRAGDDANAIVRMVAEKYRPARIWQWGSLVDEHAFSENSDIDIGIEGLGSAEAFFGLYGDAMKMTDLPLDIVELEKIEPEFADLIRTKGRIVYERT